MSRLMRRGRRDIPSPLNIGRAPAPIIGKVDSLSPRRLLSPRQFVVTILPVQATALPTPVTTILSTITTTVIPTAFPTAPSVSAAPVQTQIPTTAAGISTAPVPTIQADQTTTVGGGDAPTTVANVTQGSNMPVIAGVAGAAGFSFLTIALYFYVRNQRVPSAKDIEKRNTLDMRRAQAIAGQLNRPYSSRERMG